MTGKNHRSTILRWLAKGCSVDDIRAALVPQYVSEREFDDVIAHAARQQVRQAGQSPEFIEPQLPIE